MVPSPAELTLELTPESRLDVINVSDRIAAVSGDLLAPYPKAAYVSYHTTAGYYEQRLCARLGHDAEAVEAFVTSFQKLFPQDAAYRHDQMDLREELTEEQKACEPRNADSHLTYIGSGLENLVTYDNDPKTPVFFIELDGINGSDRRRRRTTVIGYHREMVAHQMQLVIPVSDHTIDSVNLRDPRLGLFDELQHHLAALDITKGRIEVRLAPTEGNTGLTVNEYETLLMQYDLADVLRNPLRHVAEKGFNMLRDPRSVPSKAKNYAKYDLVQLANEFIDALGLSESLVERVINKFIGGTASRFLRMKRGVRLLVSDREAEGQGQIVQGTYQSPILVQWRKSQSQTRLLDVTFIRFE